ncbi:hypothetical protein [Burkholderia sp. PU8-34]
MTTNEKSPAPVQASEAIQQRTEAKRAAEGIVAPDAAGNNRTSLKVCAGVSRADALTDELRFVLSESLACIDDPTNYLYPAALKAKLRSLLATSPVEQPAAAPINGLIGPPLRDDQRQRAQSLYRSLPHEWDSGDTLITKISADAYTNGVHDGKILAEEPAAPAPADERAAFREALTLAGRGEGESSAELATIWSAAVSFAEQRAASANETGAEGAIVGAWVADDDRAITAAQKQRALDEGGATASAVRPYAIPCYLGKSPAMAAEAAKSVATVRVKHGGYAMELSTHVAYALPEGMHELYAAPQPPARRGDGRRKCAASASLESHVAGLGTLNRVHARSLNGLIAVAKFLRELVPHRLHERMRAITLALEQDQRLPYPRSTLKRRAMHDIFAFLDNDATRHSKLRRPLLGIVA